MKRSRQISPKRLADLWTVYASFRQSQIAPSTYQRDYRKISRRLDSMKRAAPFLETAIEIRDWLLKHYSAETARRTIQQFNACCRWAKESDLIRENPFEGLQRHIRPTRQGDRAWAAFTVQERDRIIQEFEATEPLYAPWVKFLFWTGCRPEEAAALQWQHIAQDFTEIFFCEALPTDVKKPQQTKNYETTRFPCNNRLQRLLREMYPSPCDRLSPLFKGVNGGRFRYDNFLTRRWSPLVHRLVRQGDVAFYLPQYHCRHTWITEALNHLSISDVAYLARVSPNVLYRHYAGRSRRILVPEF